MAARMMVFFLSALLSTTVAAASMPDPTAPPISQSTSDPASASTPAGLAWVRVQGRNSVAWFGGTTVKLGDAVEGGRVTDIREDHIVISGKDGRRAVYLLDPSVRKQPQAHPRPARKTRK